MVISESEHKGYRLQNSKPDYGLQQKNAIPIDLFGSEMIPVVVALPLDGPFTYLATGLGDLKPGQFVSVPFGNKLLNGVVWDAPCDSGIAPKKLKSIETVLDIKPLPRHMLDLIDELANQTLSPRGSLLRMAMSVPAALEAGPMRNMLVWQKPTGLQEMPAEFERLCDRLGEEGCQPQAQVAKSTSLTPSRIKRLVTQGWLKSEIRDLDDARLQQNLAFEPIELNVEQKDAIAAIRERRHLAPDAQILLEGVPGSGKTEVYFEAIADTLQQGQTALVLLPEIALSGQWLQRFKQRFGLLPALWHSGCTAAQRRKTWKDVARGDVRVLVGTRSSLFLPFPKLGLIVIDEEHDPSYKQEDVVVYDARLAARIRAGLEKAMLIFASATPSLETVVDAERGDGLHLKLIGRHGKAEPPAIELADVRSRERHAGFIGQRLKDALKANLASGRQSMLFLNRRGFAPLMTCRSCGYRFDCGNCTAWLTIHQYRKRMLCHHCGFNRPIPDHCPECGTVDCTVAVGPGVERVAEEVRRFLPDARTALVTSDTITSSRKAEEFVAEMEAGRIDIVIGTQLVAKGHDFKNLTLVGIVDADASLAVSDPRASERCFQLLYQLAGRSGRADERGQVIIQTRQPDHAVIEALCQNDREGFLALEREEREFAKLPPFGRLAAFIISGREQQDVRHLGTKLVRNAPQLEGMRVLGPAPAPLAMLRGSYRERLLIKAELTTDLASVIREWLRLVPVPSRLRLTVDIDPQSFY